MKSEIVKSFLKFEIKLSRDRMLHDLKSPIYNHKFQIEQDWDEKTSTLSVLFRGRT